MQIAVLGMGKMGKNIAEKLMSSGHEVVIWNRSHDVLEQIRVEKASFIVKQKLHIVFSLEDLKNSPMKPRVIWLMLPSGKPTEEVIQQLENGVLEQNDILI